jgi:hypothetical protein
MNGPDLSTAPIPELVSLTGTGGSARPVARTAERADPTEPAAPFQPTGTPDAEIAIADTLVRVHAMFHVDPETNRIRVSVVDEHGKVVRLIPPESVAEMLAAMAAYPTSI